MSEALGAVKDYLLTVGAACVVFVAAAATALLWQFVKQQSARIRDERLRKVAEACILWVEARGKQWTSDQKLIAAIDRAAEKYGVKLDEDAIEEHLARLKAIGVVRRAAA